MKDRIHTVNSILQHKEFDALFVMEFKWNSHLSHLCYYKHTGPLVQPSLLLNTLRIIVSTSPTKVVNVFKSR